MNHAEHATADVIPRIEHMPAFCINLDRRLDRWKKFSSQPGAQRIHIERHAAVDARDINYMTDNRISTFAKINIADKCRHSHAELSSVGAVGCALSHASVWDWIDKNDAPFCVVFEDDCAIPPDFVDAANACIAKLNALHGNQQSRLHWGIWLLGGNLLKKKRYTEDPSIRLVQYFQLFHAYVITRECAALLRRSVFPIHGHIDHWISQHARVAGITMVSVRECRLAQCIAFDSDIQKLDMEFFITLRLSHVFAALAICAIIGVMLFALLRNRSMSVKVPMVVH